MSTSERLDRLERATAENTRWIKGDWQGPAASAAAQILAEQRAAARATADREDAIRAEVQADADAEVDRRLAESSI